MRCQRPLKSPSWRGRREVGDNEVERVREDLRGVVRAMDEKIEEISRIEERSWEGPIVA